MNKVFNLNDDMDDGRQIITKHVVRKLNSSAARPAWTSRSDGLYIFFLNSSRFLLRFYKCVSCGIKDHPWRRFQYFQFRRAELQDDPALHVFHNHRPSSGNGKLTDERRKQIVRTLKDHVLHYHSSSSPLPVAIFAGDFNCHPGVTPSAVLCIEQR